MDLHKVRKNCILTFPYGFREQTRVRGMQGYVVDLDAPCEAEWCKDQEWKLAPAPEAKEAAKIVHPQALAMIRKELAKPPVAKDKPEVEQPVGAGVGDGGTDPLKVDRPRAAKKAG